MLGRFLCVLQIGTVFASENYICPNAVGVDIGMKPSTCERALPGHFANSRCSSMSIKMSLLLEIGFVPKQTLTAYGKGMRDIHHVAFMLQGVACVLSPWTICIRMM